MATTTMEIMHLFNWSISITVALQWRGLSLQRWPLTRMTEKWFRMCKDWRHARCFPRDIPDVVLVHIT